MITWSLIWIWWSRLYVHICDWWTLLTALTSLIIRVVFTALELYPVFYHRNQIWHQRHGWVEVSITPPWCHWIQWPGLVSHISDPHDFTALSHLIETSLMKTGLMWRNILWWEARLSRFADHPPWHVIQKYLVKNHEYLMIEGAADLTDNVLVTWVFWFLSLFCSSLQTTSSHIEEVLLT